MMGESRGHDSSPEKTYPFCLQTVKKVSQRRSNPEMRAEGPVGIAYRKWVGPFQKEEQQLQLRIV